MATGAKTAFGTLLKLGDGGNPTETFTTIAEVVDLSGPSMEMEALDATSHSSTDGWKEYVGGLLDGGEVELEVNFMPANATQSYSTGLLRDMVNRTARNFQIVWPMAAPVTWSFAALITGFEPAAPIDDVLKATFTLQITGKPTLA